MDYLKENYRKILAVIVVAALIVAAYFFLTPQVNTIAIDIAEANRAEVNRTVKMLRDVRKIDINKSIFTDEVFTSLQDVRVKLPQYETGKSNPFKPLPTSTLEALEKDVAQEENGESSGGEEEIVEISV